LEKKISLSIKLLVGILLKIQLKAITFFPEALYRMPVIDMVMASLTQ